MRTTREYTGVNEYMKKASDGADEQKDSSTQRKRSKAAHIPGCLLRRGHFFSFLFFFFGYYSTMVSLNIKNESTSSTIVDFSLREFCQLSRPSATN